MKLPHYIEEENSFVKKYLYPIMYEDKETNIKLVYSDELNELKEKLAPSIVEILSTAMARKKIAIVDSTLSKEEQMEFIRKFAQQNVTKVELTSVKDEVENFTKDNLINIELPEIVEYLSSKIKQKVNMFMTLEMPYIIEKLDINDDVTMIMVILDVMINSKSEMLSGIIINNNVRNSCVMGTPLKDIAAYYKSDIFGPVNNGIVINPTVENLERIFKSLSTVSNEKISDYILDVIADVSKEQTGTRKK